MEAKTLALYLGCQFVYRWSPPKNGWNQSAPMTLTLEALLAYQNDGTICPTLLLRPLSSMTEEDFIECKVMSEKLVRGFGDQQKLKFKVDGFGGFTIYKTDAYVTKWLLSKGFDLFGLIEKNEALDSTKL